jgi:hypothetical protein
MRQGLSWALAGGALAAGSGGLGGCLRGASRRVLGWGFLVVRVLRKGQQHDAGRGRHDDGGDEQPEVHAGHE